MIKPVRKDEIPKKAKKETLIEKEIREFLESDECSAEYINERYKDIYSAYGAVIQFVKRNGLPIKVERIGKRVFLIKE